MKTSHLALGLLVAISAGMLAQTNAVQGQTTNTQGYVIVERGLDYRIWQATNADSNGHVGRYTELSPGVCYTNAYGQCVDSVEQIDILPQGGAAATQGRHHVYFPGDIYTGVIQVVTPDGRILSHRPVGVSFYDGSNAVWIAKLKDCQGYLVGSNKVVYPDAFTGVKADLVCTYRKGGFENDLVFRQQPPSPDAYGLDPASSILQLYTEFFNTQDPQQIPSTDDPNYDLSDVTLKFGQLRMVRGKAFIVGQQVTNTVPVYKTWMHWEGRTFLVEQLPLEYLADDLQGLPPSTNILTSQLKAKDPILYVAQTKRQFPPARGVTKDTTPMLVAAMDLEKQPGVVLDYDTVNDGQSGVTFQAGQTYLVRGTPTLSGNTTIQGGAVIKFDSGYGGGWSEGSCLQLFGSLTCNQADTLSPILQNAVLTDINDDTVGEPVGDGSGVCSINEQAALIYANNWPNTTTPWQLNNLKFYYGLCGFWADDNNDVVLRDCQFINDDSGVATSSGNMYLHNVLFSACWNPVYGSQGVWGNNITADGYGIFCSGAYSLTLVDCLLTGGNVSDGSTHLLPSVTFSCVNAPTSVFQSGLGGGYYLNPASSYVIDHLVDQGSQSASAAGLTYYTTRADEVPERNTQVDIGFHYQPVDANGNGLPDAWELANFGNLNQTATGDFDGDGVSNLQEYLNGTNPNKIQFTVNYDNLYVNHLTVAGSCVVQAGVPAQIAVLVDNANLSTATWQAYSPNFTCTLPDADGNHRVLVALRGRTTYYPASTVDTELTLDRVPPTLTVTNPTTPTVIKPYLQLQGYADEPLVDRSYDLQNGLGLVTGQHLAVVGQFLDTNKFDFTTNYLQAYDIPLTNGLNTITLRVSDRAGNVATKTINVTLDYSTATVPPVMQVLWPPAGVPVSGNTFYVRGTIDNETATITAQLVDAANNVTTYAGIVERNGMFWVENLPLGPGTSVVTLTATDAAGNVSTQSLTVVQSSVALAISSTPQGDALYQPSGTVSGTVTPGYNVSVNGVPATVDGSGNWSANNVPNYGQGTATFDATATPAGGNAPAPAVVTPPAAAASTETELGAMVLITAYWMNQTSTTPGHDITYAELTKWYTASADRDDAHKTWKKTYNGGAYLDEQYKDDSRFFERTTDYAWSDLNPDGTYEVSSTSDPTISGSGIGDMTSVPHKSPEDLRSKYLHHYYGKSVHWTRPDDDGELYEVTLGAKTAETLYTGGKASVSRRNLFCLTASPVLEYGRAYVSWPLEWAWDPTQDIGTPAASRVTIGGQPVGNDYKLWTVREDNSQDDVTVAISGAKHYNAGVGQQKYRLRVRANSSILNPEVVVSGAQFCVGQYIQFSPDWMPGEPPGIQNKWPILWHVDGTFMNSQTNIIPGGSFPTSSDVYYLNPDSLKQEVLTNCWWVSGGTNNDANTPAVYKAVFGEGLTFNNGQYVAIVALGQFNMYKPHAVIAPITTWVSAEALTLLFGSYSPLTNGIYFYNSIDYPVNFSGTTKFSQVIVSVKLMLQDTFLTNHFAKLNGSSPYLDGDPYQPGNATPVDAPSLGLSGPYVRGEASESFETWMMFRPLSGHWVPLRAVNWFWGGSATNGASGWQLESDPGDHSVNPPDFPTENYPLWRGYYQQPVNFDPPLPY